MLAKEPLSFCIDTDHLPDLKNTPFLLTLANASGRSLSFKTTISVTSFTANGLEIDLPPHVFYLKRFYGGLGIAYGACGLASFLFWVTSSFPDRAVTPLSAVLLGASVGKAADCGLSYLHISPNGMNSEERV